MDANIRQTWPVLADAVFPVNETAWRLTRDLLLVVGACLFTALLAQVAIPLGFTPVPITGQTLAVLLTGAALGSRRGAAAMLLYLVAGSWLPFYAEGASGFVWSLTTGGYIVGFIPAAFAVGYLAERGWDRKVWILLAMLAGNVILYVPGLLWLARFVVPEWGCGNALTCGLYPFILGDLIKLYVASLLLPGGWALVNLIENLKGRS